MGDELNVVDFVALTQGGLSIGMSLVLLTLYFRRQLKLHVILMVTSYLLLTVVNVEAAARWMHADSWRLWVSVTAWLCGDVGLFVALVRHPERAALVEGGR